MGAVVIEVKEEVERFLNAIHALLPSSNYVSQYLFTSGLDYPTIYELFPEFLADPILRDEIAKAFGVEYGYNVSLRPEFGRSYVDFMQGVFRFLEISNVRTSLCKLLGVSDDVLLHPRKQWIRAIIEGFRSDRERGELILRALKILCETREPFKYWRSSEDLCEVLKINSEELDRLINYPLSLRLMVSETKEGKTGYCFSAEIQPYVTFVVELLEEVKHQP